MTREEALAIIQEKCPECVCLPNGCNLDEDYEPESGGTGFCAKCKHNMSDEMWFALRRHGNEGVPACLTSER